MLTFCSSIQAPIAARLMRKIGRKKGFILGCILGIIGALFATSGTILEAEVPAATSTTSMGFSFTLLCLGTLFLGFTNGFINMIRFAAAEVVEDKKNYAIAGVMFGKLSVSILLSSHISMKHRSVFCGRKPFPSYVVCFCDFITFTMELMFVVIYMLPLSPYLYLSLDLYESLTNKGRF